MEYEQFLSWSIWPIDVTQTGSTTPDLSGTVSNGNEKILARSSELEPDHQMHISVILRTQNRASENY